MALADKYTLVTLIEENAVVRIHRGFRKTDGRSVVVKVLRDEYPSDLHLARLRHEHDIIVSLDAPGVVRTHGLEPSGNGLALVLDDAGEHSLDRLERTERLTTRQALQIAAAVARILAGVHERNVLHKGLKPQHVFVDPKDFTRVTLIGFDIATRLTRERQAASTIGGLDGFLPYIAPEQTGRMNRVVDRRSDLYSLGAILYELFTGRLPFPNTEPLELVHAHLARDPEPPVLHRADLPPVVSDIIQKLLRKVAEERYQSALGLASDLERCLEELTLRGSVGTFRLGEYDADGELKIPQRLFGRDAELDQLLAAYARVRTGPPELCLLTGYSGTGKTALVQELRAHLVTGGYFASGSFEYISRNVPYAALAHACQQVVRSVLTEPPEALQACTRRLLTALGANAQIMIDLVPELGLVLGPQPKVPELGPAEAHHRFEHVFQSFLLSFIGARDPLVLFLDDLQWADSASLRLLNMVLNAPEARNLLILGAYRDNEVDSHHPLILARDEAVGAGACLNEIAIGPLTPPDVAAFVADALAQDVRSVEALAAVLMEKTRGNPLSLGQLLMTLTHEGTLHFDAKSRAWAWDLAAIGATLASDNVVELTLRKLGQLGEGPQRLLQVAACIGSEFDADTLESVVGGSREELERHLWTALNEGLVIPLDSNYRYGRNAMGERAGFTARFQFLHSRVQQASYQQLDDGQRRAIHLAIGRRLLGNRQELATDSPLFDIADHLNRGAVLITGMAERRRLASVNLTAGRAARAAAASEAAARYLAAAIGLLGEAGWVTDYRLLLDAHVLKAECDYLNGQVDVALADLDTAERHAQNLLDRIPARNIRSHLLTNIDRLGDAVANSIETIRLLGESVPAPDDPAALGAAIRAEFDAFQRERAGRSVASLGEVPEMTVPERLALMEAYAKTIPAAFQSVQELMVVVVLKAARLQLRHGRAPLTPFIHNQYGLVHTIITDDMDTGYQFGKLGVELAARIGNPALAVPGLFIFAGFLSHWREPVHVSVKHLRTAVRQGLETGDRFHSNYAAAFVVSYRFYAGDPLDEIEEDLPFALDLANRTGDVIVGGFLVGLRQAIRALRGTTIAPHLLDDADFTEAAFEATASPPVRAFYGVCKAPVRFLAGKYEETLETTERFRPLPNILYQAEYKLYHGLALAELARASAGETRDRLLERLREDAATVARWAEGCPANHGHRSLLLQAEQAAAEGLVLAAIALYDDAIEQARANGFIHHQALANERCARFLTEQGRAKIARPYLIEARYAYDRWGATAKTRELDATYPDLFAPTNGLEGAHPLGGGLRAVTNTAPLEGLDLATVVSATETIASELVLGTVLERLMRTVIENAGAQRGFLILCDDANLRLAAAITVSPDEVYVGLSEPIDQATQYSSSVVRYVARTGLPAVLNDAVADHDFKGDTYIQQHRPKSLLCVPMSYRGRLRGVLYLENNAVTNAFTPARLRLLQFLAVQAAIAVENARLYGELNTATESLRKANETLESQVAERTAELQRALSEIWSEMDLARKIQTVLLPEDRRVQDYEVAATMIPADSVGGDYYDVIQTDDSSWVVIGDVSGHGVPAGLIMVMFQTAIRTLVSTAAPGERLSPATVLSRANQAVRSNLERVGKGQYMTVTALQLRGPDVRFSGLHLDILVYRAALKTVECVATHGVWLGVLDDVGHLLANQTLRLEPGDTLLLYTDGLTEAKSRDGLLGTSSVVARFKDLATETMPPTAIVRGMLGVLEGCRVDDDVTLMAVRYAPTEVERAERASDSPSMEAR
ncbi:MAG: AAA family ATPase [Polyangiaceae bacterium]|nr:AAA family ATPase [Polyangiaceae bacterium]